MNSLPAPTFTIGRKLGLVFLALVALLGVVCFVVVLELRRMQLDAERVFEETQEANTSQELLSGLETLEIELENLRRTVPPPPGAEERIRARIAASRALAQRFEAGPTGRVDPSREEHELEEIRVVEAFEQELAAIEAALRSGSPADLQRHVDRSRHCARSLAEEMWDEAGRANRDLLRRKRAATWIMIGTLVSVACSLLLVLWFVRRVILDPILALQQRALCLGRGEPLPPGRIHSRDEIGALARSFAEMAERVSATREDLEQRVAERTREFLRAARYAEIGVLAAGVAHEVNNPLASIASCAEGLQRRLKRGPVAPEEEHEYLSTIVEQAYRAREVTAGLLKLSRQDARSFSSVGLSEVCEQIAKITRHQLEQRGVRLELELELDLPPIEGDALELGQMLVNLIVNAGDASPAGGTVRIALRREGSRVLLSVEDEGAGVPPEHMERVFDPFFTTKRPGEGTGLGLALVAAIAKGHGGAVRVERAVSGGARFVVELPVASSVEAA